jgi:hypothetical protein
MDKDAKATPSKNGVQIGVQLARFRKPVSGLNGAESTVHVKFNSRMLYR